MKRRIAHLADKTDQQSMRLVVGELVSFGIENGDNVVDKVETLDGDSRTREANPNRDVLEDDIDIGDEPRAHLLSRDPIRHRRRLRVLRALIEDSERRRKVSL